jgi:hypothetical protein
VLSAAILALFAVWLAAGIAAHRRPADATFGLGAYLAPHWRLFTGSPRLFDIDAYYREQVWPGQFTEWRRVPDPERRWWERAWGPRRRRSKLLGDVARELIGLRLSGRTSEVGATAGYQRIMQWTRARAGATGAVQFALRAESSDWPPDTPRLLFVSDLHPA